MTPAQILFQDKQILNERPPDMNYQDYRILRNHQTKLIRKLFPGPVNHKIQQAMRSRVKFYGK